MKRQFQGILALLTATIIWGSTFVAQSVGMDYIGPFTFQSLRCLLAFIFLLICALLQSPKTFLDLWKNKRVWKAGSLCGIALFASSSLQQVGLLYTDAGKAGFLTAMYIVLVPVLGIFLKKKPPKSTLPSVILSMAGLYLLSAGGLGSINRGDLLILGCAFAYSVQITLVDQLTPGLNGLHVNCIQCLVCGILSVPPMLLSETVHYDRILQCWLPLGYAGILSLGAAYTLQIVGQQRVEPTKAALIMSLESVFAAVGGWLILHESMTGKELLGCGLIFAAVILSQIPFERKNGASG